mgnify:FL=1
MASEWQVTRKHPVMPYNPDLVTRTWHVRKATAATIANTADSLGIGHSELVQFLLNFGLVEVSAGRLVLTVRPVKYELVDVIEDRFERPSEE